MLRTSLISWIALSAALLVLGLWLGNVVLLSGAVFVLLVALLSATLSPPAGITVQRSLPHSTCWAGDTLTISRKLTVRRGVGPVFVHDMLPSELQVVEGNNLRVLWKWPGDKTFDISYEVHLPKRGQFVLERSTWQSQAPFGIKREASGVSEERFEISVVPRIRSVTRLSEVRATTKNNRYLGDIAVNGVATNEFRQIRPYQPGDPMKRINWKASARGSRSDNLPLVNDPEAEARRAVWIFLDVADYMDVGSTVSSPLENTVAASGALAQYYLWKGSTLGAYAYNNSGGAGELLAPESGRKQFNQLVRMLTTLKPGPPRQNLLQAVERCKDFIFRLRPEVFIITRLDVYYARQGTRTESFDRFRGGVNRLTSLRARSRRQGQVQVVHVAPQEPEPYMETPDLSKWEAHVVAGALREAGASVIEWEPAREDFTSVLIRHMNAHR